MLQRRPPNSLGAAAATLPPPGSNKRQLQDVQQPARLVDGQQQQERTQHRHAGGRLQQRHRGQRGTDATRADAATADAAASLPLFASQEAQFDGASAHQLEPQDQRQPVAQPAGWTYYELLDARSVQAPATEPQGVATTLPCCASVCCISCAAAELCMRPCHRPGLTLLLSACVAGGLLPWRLMPCSSSGTSASTTSWSSCGRR